MSSVSSSQREKIRSLKEVIGLSDKGCKALLQECGWNVSNAANLFFTEGYEDSSDEESSAIVSVDMPAVNKWFDSYLGEEDEEKMTVDGIVKFCEDIDVDPEDIVMLIISYHMQASKMLEYSRDEFLTGMSSIGCSNAEELKSNLNSLREQLNDKATFKKVYLFTYLFAKKQGVKSLDRDSAIALWQILLVDKFPLLDKWCAFVENNHKHAITKDEWTLTFDFVHQINEDMSNYDENGAWPLLVDEFVEHILEQNEAK